MATRAWKPSDRTREQLVRVLQVIDILSFNRSWTTVEEMRADMESKGCGDWCWRTIERDLHLLEAVGIAEHREFPSQLRNGCKKNKFRMVRIDTPKIAAVLNAADLTKRGR